MNQMVAKTRHDTPAKMRWPCSVSPRRIQAEEATKTEPAIHAEATMVMYFPRCAAGKSSAAMVQMAGCVAPTPVKHPASSRELV